MKNPGLLRGFVGSEPPAHSMESMKRSPSLSRAMGLVDPLADGHGWMLDSTASVRPSLSSSGSHTSPKVSEFGRVRSFVDGAYGGELLMKLRSLFSWSGLGSNVQLSVESATPSQSLSGPAHGI